MNGGGNQSTSGPGFWFDGGIPSAGVHRNVCWTPPPKNGGTDNNSTLTWKWVAVKYSDDRNSKRFIGQIIKSDVDYVTVKYLKSLHLISMFGLKLMTWILCTNLR